MAFRQHHRPQPSRQLSFHSPERPAEVGTASSPQRKRPLEDSEEWVLFSPTAAPSATRTYTTSTERTPRTAGLSRFSDFGSLDTAARSDQEYDDNLTCQGTDPEEEGELDSLDDGLHAFHEPSEYSAPSRRVEQSGDTVLPTHDGLGTFQANSSMIQEQLWQFERSSPRRRHQRRRSSVQTKLDALEESEKVDEEHDRRQRIEKWRIEQSRALLEEIERETRRRRKMSLVSAARSRTDSAHQEEQPASWAGATGPSLEQREAEDSSDDSSENLTFWQRITRRVIRDLMGIDEDILSVIFGEALPAEVIPTTTSVPDTKGPSELLDHLDMTEFPGEPWQHRILERIARELGILVHQLSEHPGAFNTYLRTQETPPYALAINTSTSAATGLSPTAASAASQPSLASPTAALFAPTLPHQQSASSYSEASLWGIEEEPESDPLDTFRQYQQPPTTTNPAEDLARSQQEREYWERELDVKMVFNFLTKRFSSRPSTPDPERSTRRSPAAPLDQSRAAPDLLSARRAALIRQHHPLVSRNADRSLDAAASSGQQNSSNAAIGNRKRDMLHRHHYHHNHQSITPLLRNSAVRSSSGQHNRAGSSGCASQSTKKSKRSGGSGRNYWDMAGSVGSSGV
ncbi:hypothetical protein K432DRAFT_325167, partial [Lepidopterella palustris CBS 459.81]